MATSGEKEIKRYYPVVSGLGANDKHEGRQINLVPRGKLGVKTLVRKDIRDGLDGK